MSSPDYEQAIRELAEARIFDRYEVVRRTGDSGSPTHTVYGVRTDGLRVVIDRLFLKDHDAELAEARAEVERLKATTRAFRGLVDRACTGSYEDGPRGTIEGQIRSAIFLALDAALAAAKGDR